MKRSPKTEFFEDSLQTATFRKRRLPVLVWTWIFLKTRIKKVAFSNENGYVWTRPEIIDFISGGNINKNTLFLYNKYAYSVIFMAVLQNANSFKSLTCGIAASL